MTDNQFSTSVCRQPLNGAWQFRQQGEQQWLPATVPGCNFTDLLANQRIEDPFFRDNETNLQWIEREDWHYRRTFELNSELTGCDAIELVAEGLDTFCDIFLNGHRLGRSENMFVGQRIECKSLLRQGENLLEIHFRSPINEVMPRYRSAGFAYPAENDKSDEKLSVYCRKAPCHFGWDWGPRFVTSGIWRDIYLQGTESARIDELHFVQHQLSADQASFSLDVQLSSLTEQPLTLEVACKQAPRLNRCVSLDAQQDSLRLDFVLDNPQRWWPNGLGEAFLYEFELRLKQAGKLIDQRSQRIGLRSIEVINQPDEMGESFYFKVNGEPVFIKGANYIPGDSFIHRMTPQRHREYFDAARQANMNMLRVWGGGIYQDDIFYRLADENGILIWQDFMFACTLYPADDEFIANVTREAEYNIKRLRNHACLAMWCGNNEVDMAIKHWQWPQKFGYSDELYKRLKQDYIRLFDQCLPEQVETLDPERFYLRSSPIGFWEEDADHMGNHHYWGVWHGEEPFSEYQKRVPRFMSEFGFQSFPMPESVARYTEPGDRQLESPVMQVHQKHPRGNHLICAYLEQEYKAPKDFDALLYLSQVQQAQGLKLAFEAHRAARPFCMGTLYWQLNDTWPAASWSGIDYYGQYKALHYQAQRNFAPYLLTVTEQQQRLSITLVSDLLASEPASLHLRLLDFDGHCHWQQQQVLDTPANTSRQLLELSRAELLKGKAAENLVLQVQLQRPDNQLLAENLYYFVPANQQALPQASAELEVVARDDMLEVRLSSVCLLRQCYLSLAGVSANFSDNFFDLLPGQPKSLSLALPGKSQAEIQHLSEGLCCISLADSYQE
ncbi:beta-mannosidase [Lacimicrobium alkaliphilum]|uniref:Beta-mannosidase B n=1 Tax=Lacimicrobium alkaliphilum TaxID=1526571 RepID=A0A0U2ZL98_9ALTE|nr:glycoside hydrolase family 2 protein [Lacimicrobium alkaliphilum]ALS99783.1 glycoside hydrolase [Lacimicrobium alkaliphilum]